MYEMGMGRAGAMKCKRLNALSCSALAVVVLLQVLAAHLLRGGGPHRAIKLAGADGEAPRVSVYAQLVTDSSSSDATGGASPVGGQQELPDPSMSQSQPAGAAADAPSRDHPTSSSSKASSAVVSVAANAKPRVLLWNRYFVPEGSGGNGTSDQLELSKHAGNIGNDVWRYAGSHSIFDREAMELVEVWPEDPQLKRDQFDVHILPVANLIWPIENHKLSYHQEADEHLKTVIQMRKILEDTDRPAFMYGLGIQGYESIGKSTASKHDLGDPLDLPRNPTEYVLHGEYIKMLAALSRRSQAIGVRGEFSRQVLGNYGVETLALGCPSLFLNARPDLGIVIRGKIDAMPENPRLVIMLPARYGKKYFAFYFDQLRRHPDSVVILQGETDYDFLKMAERELNTTIPTTRLRFFSDYKDWVDFICGFDGIVGGRIHGSMIGLNCPIPVLLIPTDLRTDELGSIMRIPIVRPNSTVFQKPPAEITIKQLHQVAGFSAKEFDSNRKSVANQYDAILRRMNLPASKTIRELAAMEVA
jgi:hypothetical protein